MGEDIRLLHAALSALGFTTGPSNGLWVGR